MGKGIDAARAIPGVNAEALDALENFRDQLLIVLLKRLGGRVSIPVAEADDTGGQIVMMEIKGGAFHFEVGTKQ